MLPQNFTNSFCFVVKSTLLLQNLFIQWKCDIHLALQSTIHFSFPFIQTCSGEKVSSSTQDQDALNFPHCQFLVVVNPVLLLSTGCSSSVNFDYILHHEM